MELNLGPQLWTKTQKEIPRHVLQAWPWLTLLMHVDVSKLFAQHKVLGSRLVCFLVTNSSLNPRFNILCCHSLVFALQGIKLVHIDSVGKFSAAVLFGTCSSRAWVVPRAARMIHRRPDFGAHIWFNNVRSKRAQNKKSKTDSC